MSFLVKQSFDVKKVAKLLNATTEGEYIVYPANRYNIYLKLDSVKSAQNTCKLTLINPPANFVSIMQRYEATETLPIYYSGIKFTKLEFFTVLPYVIYNMVANNYPNHRYVLFIDASQTREVIEKEISQAAAKYNITSVKDFMQYDRLLLVAYNSSDSGDYNKFNSVPNYNFYQFGDNLASQIGSGDVKITASILNKHFANTPGYDINYAINLINTIPEISSGILLKLCMMQFKNLESKILELFSYEPPCNEITINYDNWLNVIDMSIDSVVQAVQPVVQPVQPVVQPAPAVQPVVQPVQPTQPAVQQVLEKMVDVVVQQQAQPAAQKPSVRSVQAIKEKYGLTDEQEKRLTAYLNLPMDPETFNLELLINAIKDPNTKTGWHLLTGK